MIPGSPSSGKADWKQITCLDLACRKPRDDPVGFALEFLIDLGPEDLLRSLAMEVPIVLRLVCQKRLHRVQQVIDFRRQAVPALAAELIRRPFEMNENPTVAFKPAAPCRGSSAPTPQTHKAPASTARTSPVRTGFLMFIPFSAAVFSLLSLSIFSNRTIRIRSARLRMHVFSNSGTKRPQN